jgi:hypothetical protein
MTNPIISRLPAGKGMGINSTPKINKAYFKYTVSASNHTGWSIIKECVHLIAKWNHSHKKNFIHGEFFLS